MKALALALALAYPFLAHVAVVRSDPRLMAAGIAALVLALLLPALARGRPAAYAVAAAVALLLAAALKLDAVAFLLYVPPVALNALAGWAFARTLAPGRTPLIEQFARVMHGAQPLDPGIPAYARRLTFTWAALLFSIAAIDAVLALLAVPGGVLVRAGIAPPIAVPQAWWSLFANFLGWLLIGLLFAGEWLLRKRRFPVQPYRGFGEYARRLAAVGPELWRAR
ncbi:MAG TPA: ketosynthase [Candidatus Saccharimonadia bacterium]|nr:ketosynthase [Candidatus Saccharimonadia bacterium]